MFYNAGQDCTAATRVIVHESIHAEFLEAAKAGLRQGRASPI
jgi:betaine-aldehyde dehydrogenase